MRCSRLRAALLLCASGLLLASAARAQEGSVPPVGPPGAVSVEVMISYVSAQPGSIDPRAAELARLLNREFKLQTLRVLQLRRLSLALQEMGRLQLPTGHWLSVRPEEFTPAGVRIGVEIQDMLRTHVNIPNGNQVVIGAYSYEEGRLVIRLAPTYRDPGVLPGGQ